MGFKENLAFFKKVIFKNNVMCNQNWTMMRCLTKRGIKKSYFNLHINVGWSISVAHDFKSKTEKVTPTYNNLVVKMLELLPPLPDSG